MVSFVSPLKPCKYQAVLLSLILKYIYFAVNAVFIMRIEIALCICLICIRSRNGRS